MSRLPLRVGVIVLPIATWREALPIYRRLEELGVDTAWFYDHLVWRHFADGPWQATVPLLTAVAASTSRLRLGTLVASPNYRHPVTFAKELMTVDDVSDGRVTLGLGAGALSGWDTTALGQEAWSRGERTARFEEFATQLDRLLVDPRTERLEGRFYSAVEARALPGCRQRPRLPFWLAGNGPRGMRLTARLAEGWIALGEPRWPDELTPDERERRLVGLVRDFERVCAEEGRDPASLDRLYMNVPTREHVWADAATFRARAEELAALGFTDLALHYPHPAAPFDVDTVERFEAVLAEVLGA